MDDHVHVDVPCVAAHRNHTFHHEQTPASVSTWAKGPDSTGAPEDARGCASHVAPRRINRRERHHHHQAGGVSVAVATRSVVRGLQQRREKRRQRTTRLPPSIIPIAFAALLSTWAVQPAGNGRQLSAHNVVIQTGTQCPVPRMEGLNGTSWSNRFPHAEQIPWSESNPLKGADNNEHYMQSRASGHHSEDSLLLNPDFVALLVRTAFILLEFGSRPLKNAKKMLSCGLICYWLYHYRFGSEASILANRYVCRLMDDRSFTTCPAFALSCMRTRPSAPIVLRRPVCRIAGWTCRSWSHQHSFLRRTRDLSSYSSS